MDQQKLNERLQQVNQQIEQLMSNLNALLGSKNEILFWMEELKKSAQPVVAETPPSEDVVEN